MAKLFNNIRKKLVSEKPSANRTINYLKYAIGEIVLVVIGILIALQVNNWNENRKSKMLEYKYLSSISKDLDILINNTNDVFVNRFDKKIKCLYIAKKYAQDELKVTDTLDFLNSVAFGAVGFGGFDIMGKDTYQELVNTGNLRLISNDSIRKLLSDLFINALTYAEVSDSFVTGYGSFINSFKPFDFSNPNYIDKYDQKKMIVAVKTETFRKLVNQELTYAMRIQNYATKIVKLAELSKHQITNELKTKF